MRNVQRRSRRSRSCSPCADQLSTTAAILQATPTFFTLGAVVWLKEPVGWRRSTAIALGFLGVLMVIRPGLDGFQPASLWAVFAAAGFAVRDLVTRRVPAGMGSLQLSAAAFVALLVASALMALFLGETPVLPDGRQAGLMLGCGVVTVTGYALLVTATRAGEASVLAPVRYTRLVFALVLAVMIFGERLDPLEIAGAAMIVGSGCYTVWREARLAAAAPRPRCRPAPPLPPTPIPIQPGLRPAPPDRRRRDPSPARNHANQTLHRRRLGRRRQQLPGRQPGDGRSRPPHPRRLGRRRRRRRPRRPRGLRRRALAADDRRGARGHPRAMARGSGTVCPNSPGSR